MAQSDSEESSSSLSLDEILFIASKHARMIALCACLGVCAAIVVFFAVPPAYKSEAKLFVPYVVDRALVDTTNDAASTSRANDAIINSEVEILTSWDLAEETAVAIDYRGVAAFDRGALERTQIIQNITKRIEVSAAKGMNVISVSFKDGNPSLATRFLQRLLNNYRESHLKIHRVPEVLDVITQRRDEVWAQLEHNEAELKRLKENMNILSVEENTTTLSAAITKAQDELNSAQAELRGQESRVQALESLLSGQTEGAEPRLGQRASNRDAERYRFLGEQLSQLRDRERQLLGTYPPDSRMIKIPRKQISEVEEQRQELERKFPDLAVVSTTSGISQPPGTDLISERARLAAMAASVEVLDTQLQGLQKKREQFLELAPQIVRLERDKELLESNYKNIESSLAKAKDDRAVDWSRIPNITSVQEPSPAARVANPLKKKLAAGLASSGLVIGLGLAFLLEKVLNRTIKRSCELEHGLRIPVFLTVPLKEQNRHAHDIVRSGGNDTRIYQNGRIATGSLDQPLDDFIKPFCDTIRDRVILSFRLRNLTRKPKLIGVAGFSAGAGCSTIAYGLASSLSEVEGCKVLLVDMTSEGSKSHVFSERSNMPPVVSAGAPENATAPSDNLFLASVDATHREQTSIGLSRLNILMPSLHAADFDYIVFDMPPLTTVSPSVGMAAYMDKVLLVLEPERIRGDVVKRSVTELVESGADVTCVFNKERSYIPRRLNS